MSKPEIIKIDEVEYIRKDTINKPAEKLDGMEYCIVRTYSAGVFAGYVDRSIKGKERTIYKSRMIWEWYGAETLSEIAIYGVTEPNKCKITPMVPERDLTEVIEVIPCTYKTQMFIQGAVEWKK